MQEALLKGCRQPPAVPGHGTAGPPAASPDDLLLQPLTDARRARLTLHCWLAGSYLCDLAILALYSTRDVIPASSVGLYAVAFFAVLAMFFWGAGLGSHRLLRWTVDRSTRALGLSIQAAFAYLYPALAFYFFCSIVGVLGFSHRRVTLTWQESLLEWVCASAVLLPLVWQLGPQHVPPLASADDRALFAIALLACLGRATLFGYWISALRESLGMVKDRYRAICAQLEEQVAQRTWHLERRSEEAAAARNQIQNMASSVAHDLRQPITTMSANLALARKAALADDAAQAVERLQKAARAVAQMERICSGLSQLLAVYQLPLQREWVDVTGLVLRIRNELAAADARPGVRVWAMDGMRMQADPVLLGLVLRQLLGNAWRFTAGQQEACIEVTQVARDLHQELHVCDDGPGLGSLQPFELFTPFARMHAQPQGGGSGVGLASAAAAAQRHGGWIKTQDAPQGAHFVLTLPNVGQVPWRPPPEPSRSSLWLG